MAIKDWRIKELTGYEPKTTFYTDFSIAEPFGITAISDTYTRAFNERKSDIVYITELVMVLNWKIWEHYETNRPLAKFYNELWTKADEWVLDNVKGDDLQYFLETVD